MSIRAMDWARQQRTGNPTLKAVLRAVADYADDHGYSWPSQLTLAADTELSERSVRDALRQLEEAGLIQRIPWRRPDNSRATDTILLVFPAEEGRSTADARVPAGRAGTPDHVPAAGAGSTGSSCRKGYRQQAPGVPAGAAGLTTFEPPLNHQGTSGGDGQASGRAGSTEGGFSEVAWHVSLERLVASGVNRESAKRFLGKCLRSLKGRGADLGPAVEAACSGAEPDAFAAILSQLKIVEPARRFVRKGRSDVLRHKEWPSDFRDIFWSNFPRKEDKLKAIKVLEFIYREDKIEFAAITAGIARLKASGVEKKYVPHAHRWLRDRRWEDEIPEQKTAKVVGATRAGTTQDFWAQDAIDAHSSRSGAFDEHDRTQRGHVIEHHADDGAGSGERRSEDRGADRVSSQQFGSDPRQLAPLRLVGRA